MTAGFFYQLGLEANKQKEEFRVYIDNFHIKSLESITNSYKEANNNISFSDFVRASLGIMLNNLLMTRIDGKAAEAVMSNSSTDYWYDIVNNILKIKWKVYPIDAITPIELDYEYNLGDYFESND